MATGDRVGRDTSDYMTRGMEAIDQIVASDHFNEQQKGFAAVMQDNDAGVGDMFSYLLDNPAIMVDSTISTIGSMFLPVGSAKTAIAATRGLKFSKEAAAKAATVATLGTIAAQNAADTFAELEGESMESRYKGATVSAGVSLLMGIATRGGAEGEIARKMAGDLKAGKVTLDKVKDFLKAVGREAIQEAGEEAGNIAGQAVGSLEAPGASNAAKQVAFAGTIGAVMGGGTNLVLRGDAAEPGRGMPPPSMPPTPGKTSPASPEAAPAQEPASPTETPPASPGADGKPIADADKDILNFARARFMQLRAKRDRDDDGDTPSTGLTENETRELEALEQNRLNPDGLRAWYGIGEPVSQDEPSNLTQEESDVSQEGASEAETISAAANESATSPLNDLPEPTDAQKEAGNYKKGHIQYDGLDLTIENPVGSERSGTDPNGNPWSVQMTAHYGYLKRSMGADGDQVDVYVAEEPDHNAPVYVFDQYNDDGTFDEHKAVIGVNSQADAEALYDAHFSDRKGPQRRKGVTAMPVSEFKEWATNGDTSTALAPEPEVVDVTPAQKRPSSQFTAYQEAIEAGQGSKEMLELARMDERLEDGEYESLASLAEFLGFPEDAAPAPAKPKTEKERNQRADYSAKWFGSREKAEKFIADKRITDTHAAVQDGKRFLIQPKEQIDGPQAPETQQAKAQGKERQQAPEAPTEVTEAIQETRAAPPGTRFNTQADRDVADHLEPLLGEIQGRRGTPEGGARDAIRVVIEELRKPRTAVGVEALLETAARRLSKNHKDLSSSVAEAARQLLWAGSEPQSTDLGSQSPFAEASEHAKTGDSTARSNSERIVAQTASSQPTQESSDLNAMFDDVLAEEIAKDEATKPKTEREAKAQRTARESAASAAKNTAAGLTAAIDGLGELFGGPNRMRTGLSFDEETYAKAKPLFQQAIANLSQAGGDLKDTMRAVVRMVLDKFGQQAAQNMKPYVVRFIQDIEQESDSADTLQAESVPARDQEQDNQRISNNDGDSQPLDAGLAGDGQGADRPGRVPGSIGRAGTTGSESEAGTRPESPVELGESGSVRPEPSTARNSDHVIDEGEIGKGSLTKKYKDNIAAIKILKTLESEGRAATPEERKTLARYVGWGAMKGPFDPDNKQWSKQHAELKELLTDDEYKAARASTLDAHYTSPVVVNAMYAALERLGFRRGRILEPSVGVGNFFGMMPRTVRTASQLYGVELDSLTSRLAAALYPNAKIAKSTGFQDFDIPGEFFDVVIGNPPFGSHILTDKDRSPYSGYSIHNYFLAKSIDKLRPGGVMAVVVSHNFLDAQNNRTRRWIGERANLIGAVRLPNNAFKENAGTEVVTDILLFQKHGAETGENIGDWQSLAVQSNTNPKTGEVVRHSVNQIFVDLPNLVLGTPSAGGTMYRADEYTVEASGDIKEKLDGWVKRLPADLFDNIDRKSDSAIVDMAIPDGIKVGSFYLDSTGKVMQRGDDVMGNKTANAWEPKNEAAGHRMRGMIGIRDALRAQMRLERSHDATAEDIEANRKKLSDLYDAFLKKYGHLNNSTNRGIFLDDPESNLIQGLEFNFDRGIGKAAAEKEGVESRPPSATKADIFNRRVAFPPQEYLTVTTANDALLASLNFRGRLDLDYMQEVYAKPADKIVEELGDVIFDDPLAGFVMADEYLSGDVKTKLAEAQAAAKADNAYRRNVAALEKVIPKDKTPSEISVSIGAEFVPASLYEQFVKHISGATAKAAYVRATGQWVVEYGAGTDSALNTGTYGTEHLSAQDLFTLTMQGRGAVVRQTVRHADGSTTTVLLEKETEAARAKQDAIKAEWQKWIWQDPDRADNLAGIYNDKMNRIVVRTFDGSHMTFPGMSPAITLLEHQKNGVWRGLQSFQVLYDHVVGAGKTFEMATLAMEMRRLGISRKPLFVVPNHLTGQWRDEFTRLYPGSNVLAATPEDFSKNNRERLFAKIITGDWDAVVIGHSSLKRIGLPRETELSVLREQLDEISEAIEENKRARGDKRITADMEKIRKNLDSKLKDKLEAVGKRSRMVTFDELGIDAMFVDEMHEFKNLTYNTTMDRNPGMGNPAGSAKAFDMFVKVRWLFDTFGEKTPFITATGTPVSNSLVEMFNMQRYMQYPTLKQHGLHVFDAWARMFGNVENVYEVAPSGSGYRQSTRFAKFTNLPALMGLYNSFADTVTLDDLKAQEISQGKVFPVPRMVGGKPVLVVAERSPAVTSFMGVPEAKTDDSGNILFDADITQNIVIAKNEETGKWQAQVGDFSLGQFDTEQDAKAKLVEKALTPTVSVDPDSILGRFGRLKELTKATDGKVNALSLTGEANKAALDYRLIDPTASDFPGSKINMAVANMMRIYEQWAADKGTQLIFSDMSIPLSARSGYSTKERKLYIRDDAGELVLKRGTMHTVEGLEEFPHHIVQRTEKDGKVFDAYDAVTGRRLKSGFKSRAEAVRETATLLENTANRQKLAEARERDGEITQGEIDEYNNEHEVEVQNAEEFFTLQDIAGMSGSASFSVYDDIKAKLVARGVPENEIAFIHDYNTPAAKSKLFRAVNDGNIRFLLGSTPKMGAGTNVQERLVGLHHIDAPWRPSDLEQREGRIIRRGNQLYARDPEGFEVFVGRYATSQTYDTRRWQILEHKARGIEQLRNYDGTANEIEDIDGEAANSADMKAAASGNPLILEETKLRNDVKRLAQLQDAHADEVLSMTRKARSADNYAQEAGPGRVSALEGLIAAAAANPLDKEGFAPLRVRGGAALNTKEEAHKAATAAFNAVHSNSLSTAAIQYRGIDFTLEHMAGNTVALKTPTGTHGFWGQGDVFSASGFVQRLKNYIDALPGSLAHTQAEIEKSRQSAIDLREQAAKPFAQAEELATARADHADVQRRLMAQGPEVPPHQKEAVAQAIEERKEALRALGFAEAVDEVFGSEPAPAPGPAVLSTAGTGRVPEKDRLSLDDLAQIAEKLIVQFRHKPPITVADSLTDIIPGAGAGADDGPVAAGMVYGGEIFLFLDGISGAQDADATLWHELVHYGLRRFLTKEQYTATLNRLYNRDPWIRQKADEWIATNGADVQHAKQSGRAYTRARGVDEALAELAEINQGEFKNNTLKAKAIRTVARWIAEVAERFGFKEFAAKYRGATNDEARALIKNLFQRLREDAPPVRADEDFTADPAFMMRRVQDSFVDFMKDRKRIKNFSWYDKSIATQQHKALNDRHYGKVFNLLLAMQSHVALSATRASSLAPGVLPKVDDVKAAAKGLFSKKDNASHQKAAKALFEGTVAGHNVMTGRVWTDAELRDKGLDEAAITLYRQARMAIDASLDEVASAEAYAMARDIVPREVRADIIAAPDTAEARIKGEIGAMIRVIQTAIASAERAGNAAYADELKSALEGYKDTYNRVNDIFETVRNLKEAGYAPLMRYGNYAVTVRALDPAGGPALDEDGNPIILFHGRYDSERKANKAEREQRELYEGNPLVRVSIGTVNSDRHKLYRGVDPESLALFAEAIGEKKIADEQIRLARSERSALKRRLERKGTEGYSEDMQRTLASFITSNARHAAQQLYMGDIGSAIKYIPTDKGDVQKEALKLRDFVLDPDDRGAAASTIMFAWFLGGSVASAAVNATQPYMVTAPFLTQFADSKTVAKAMGKAIKQAAGRSQISDNTLRDALEKARLEGVVDAQEIFHLYAVGGAQLTASHRAQSALALWASMFSAVESLNRRVTFITAWDIATQNNDPDPYRFAVSAVNQTQGIFNKVNRPNLARSTLGRLVFTYKGFSIMMVELMARTAKRGPEGRKAVMMMLAMIMLAAGEEGLPFAKALDDLIDTIGQIAGLDTNMRRWKREQLYSFLGKAWGDGVLSGVSSALPLDFAGRLGLGNVIPGTEILKPSSDASRMRAIAEIIGPSAGMAQQVDDGIEAQLDGNTAKAIQNISPKAVRDAWAAWDMLQKGHGSDARGRKTVDTDIVDAMMKGIGFNPTAVAQSGRDRSVVYQDIMLQRKTEASIAGLWARGIAANDQSMIDEAVAKRDRWNERNPKTPIAINASQLRSRIRAMNSDSGTRLLKAAPREMRGNLGLSDVD
ncbi:MAG: PLxRFG domain-containing protein [Porticoccaceae bacterium]